MEWTAGESVAVNRDNKSISVFITGKEDQKLVPIKREETVTGTETISTPNPRKDESSVDRDNYVGGFVTRDIEPVQAMEWTAEDSVTISEVSIIIICYWKRRSETSSHQKRRNIKLQTLEEIRQVQTCRGKCFGDL